MMNTTQENTMNAKTETYSLRLGGRYIKKATKVIFADGSEVKFMERMPARLAIPQAREILAKR
jgi:hypothetical protein